MEDLNKALALYGFPSHRDTQSNNRKAEQKNGRRCERGSRSPKKVTKSREIFLLDDFTSHWLERKNCRLIFSSW